MIAACPRCSVRYRIDPGRLRADGARLRCSRCQAVFRVRPPAGEAAAAPSAIDPSAVAPEAPAAAAAAERPAPAEPAAAEAAPERDPAPQVAPPEPAREPRPEERPPPADRSRLILVADPEVDAGKATASALASWGLSPILVHDGVEAILSIQRMLPSAVVIDAALPKMFGFQVCELLKRNESLCDIHVVLVGAIHNRERYRRAPSELYGADVYLERHQLPDALRAVLTDFGVPLDGPGPRAQRPAPEPAAEPRRPQAPPPEVAPEPPVPAPEPVERAPEPPVAAPAAAEPSAAEPPAHDDSAIAEAERLARIVVSDIILYNQEKFDAAIRAGNVLEAMEGELAEGRSLFAARIDARVRDRRDFLADQLLAVARSRSAG